MFLLRLLTGPGLVADKIAIVFAFVLIGGFSIILHEWSHGFIALKNGDPTAKIAGRLSFNPKVHFEITGVIMLIFVGFGWAKPVPINSYNFKNYKKGMLTVSSAGVTANLILSGLLMVILYFSAKLFFINSPATQIGQFLLMFFYFLLTIGIRINLMLALFNMLPIYPLDGYNIINTLFPKNIAYQQFMIKYGFILLLIIIGLGYIGRWLGLPWLDLFGSFNDLLNRLIDKIIIAGISL